MGQIVEMRRTRRGEEKLCRIVLILDEEWVNGDGGLMHKCLELDNHAGFHQCYCGVVYRDDGAIYVPQTLPGFPSGGTWVHI